MCARKSALRNESGKKGEKKNAFEVAFKNAASAYFLLEPPLQLDPIAKSNPTMDMIA